VQIKGPSALEEHSLKPAQASAENPVEHSLDDMLPHKPLLHPPTAPFADPIPYARGRNWDDKTAAPITAEQVNLVNFECGN
jgi:hypothetical protein